MKNEDWKNFNTYSLKEYIKVFTKIDSKFVASTKFYKKIKISILLNGFCMEKGSDADMQKSIGKSYKNIMEKIGIASYEEIEKRGVI